MEFASDIIVGSEWQLSRDATKTLQAENFTTKPLQAENFTTKPALLGPLSD